VGEIQDGKAGEEKKKWGGRPNPVKKLILSRKYG